MASLKRSSVPAAPRASASRLLTLARDLQRRKGREKRALFVAEGVRLAEEVVRARVRLKGAVVAAELEESARGRSLLQALEGRGVEIARVTARELAAIADTDTPQGVLLIAEIPARSLEQVATPEGSSVVVLDGVQDPGNAGTILRTAAALGAVATVALPGTVDLWNHKVVRGAMGAHFHAPALHSSPDELFAWLEQRGVQLWAADANGEALDTPAAQARVAVALGNEGAGVSTEVLARATRRVSLPLERGVESLNVAVAAGILLYELRRGRSAR